MRYVVSIAEQAFEIDVEPRAEGGYLVRGVEGREYVVHSLDQRPGWISLLVDGQSVSVLPGEGEVRLHGERYTARAENWQQHASTRAKGLEAEETRALSASMPGRIVHVLCAAGDRVAANAPLIVIEAMKMQNELRAKRDATVRAVHVEAGQTVERGALLIELE
jgi:biotin carboxyl carrier protein